MSVTSIGRSTRGHVVVGAPAAAASRTISDAAAAIATFIPGDVLTIYLSALAVIHTAFPQAAQVCSGNAQLAATNSGTTAANTLANIPTWFESLLTKMHFPAGAGGLAEFVFFACLLFSIVWVFGLHYINTPSGQPFQWPIWGAIAACLAFWVYAATVDNIWFGCPTVVTDLWIFFISPLLAFINEIIAKRIPLQAV